MSESTPRMGWAFPSKEDDPWFDRFVSFALAMDASGFASREDRNILLAEGGTVTWTLGTDTLAWTADIYLTSAQTGFTWRVPANSLALQQGELLIITLARNTLTNRILAPSVASTVPNTDDDIVLAVRINDRIYWRNGSLMNDGETLTNLGGTQFVGSIDLQDAYDGGEAVTIAANTPIALTTAGATEAGITIADGSDTLTLRGDSVRSSGDLTLHPDSGTISLEGVLTQAASGFGVALFGRIDGDDLNAAVSIRNTGSFVGSSVEQIGFDFAHTINQTGTAGMTSFEINRTETALGSGVQRFVHLRTGGVSRWELHNDGTQTIHGNFSVGVDNTYSLGTGASDRFSTIWAVTTNIGDLSFHGQHDDAHWTVNEDRSGLYVHDRVTGKGYRLDMTEVDPAVAPEPARS